MGVKAKKMSLSQKQFEKTEMQSMAIFQSVNPSVNCPAFLKTRVLSHLKVQDRLKDKLRFWQRVGALSSIALMVVLGIVFFYEKPLPVYQATADEPFVVKIEVSPNYKEQIEYARIELPNGVSFYSNRYPELSEKRSLELAWQGSEDFPFVIKSSLVGTQKVKVKFFGKDSKIIFERELNIRFNG